MRELARKRVDKPLPRLQRAADKRNASWLEELDPEIYAALAWLDAQGGTP